MHLFRPKSQVSNMTPPLTAIGYIRVSTEKQNEGDHALERQAEKIRRFCAERGLKVTAIYEDICSAVDDFSVARRPSLADAVKRAAREGACLIVTEPTRLFRNVEVAERWLQAVTVPVLSVQDDMVLSQSQLLDSIAAGEKVARATSEGTAKALEKKRSAGVKLGSKADRSAANAASKRSRALRSDGIVDAIARTLLEDPAYRDLSHRAFADLLNRRNVLTGWSRPWTAAGIKRQRALAEQRILEWIDLDAIEISEEALIAPPAASRPACVAVPVRDPEEDMLNLPTFGMF